MSGSFLAVPTDQVSALNFVIILSVRLVPVLGNQPVTPSRPPAGEEGIGQLIARIQWSLRV